MAIYKGAASDGGRAAHLLSKRERSRQEFEHMKHQIRSNSKFSVQSITTKYDQGNHDLIENELNITAGLTTLSEMRAKRKCLSNAEDKPLAFLNCSDSKDMSTILTTGCNDEALLSNQEYSNDISSVESKLLNKSKVIYTKKNSSLLSFSFDEVDESSSSDRDCANGQIKSKKIKKDPTIDTSFLPDIEREDEESRLREELSKEWKSDQEKLRNESIRIVYSYWDGSGHKRTALLKKGDTISKLLQSCIDTMKKDFHELRTTSAEDLMFIKQDLILPHHYSFYDFIANNSSGKSGPLFQSFDNHESILNESLSSKYEESHAGKICLRSWYDKNKHIFPSSRWEPFNPEKKCFSA